MRGIDRIAAERVRQITEEGFTAAHDAEHSPDELVAAGNCYADFAKDQLLGVCDRSGNPLVQGGGSLPPEVVRDSAREVLGA